MHDANDHLPGCAHNDLTASSLGMPTGVMDLSGQSILIDLDRLATYDETEPSFGTGGGGRPGQACSPPLRALLWILLARAGLIAHHREFRPKDPWVCLIHAANELRAVSSTGRSTSLRDRMLFPKDAVKDDALEKRNKDIFLATKALGKMAFAATLFPDQFNSPADGDFYRLKSTFGVSVCIDGSVFRKGIASKTEVAKLCSANDPLLVIGILEQRPWKDDPKRFTAWATGVAAIPVVGSTFAPVPTLNSRRRYDACMADGSLFVADPVEDRAMRIKK
jgi:hypothetical protein